MTDVRIIKAKKSDDGHWVHLQFSKNLGWQVRKRWANENKLNFNLSNLGVTLSDDGIDLLNSGDNNVLNMGNRAVNLNLLAKANLFTEDLTGLRIKR